jgi:hypothetical protein
MTAFLQGISQFLPEIQPYQPDLNFFGNMLQTKQYQYDQGYNQVNNLYASLLNAPVLRQESAQRRDEFFKKIQSGIQKISTLDLSLEQNVNSAAKIFQPLIDDEDINYDMMRTGQYQQELAKAERLKNCIDPKDCGGQQFWEGGVRALNYWAQDFSKSSADQARQFGKPTYTPYINVAKNAMEDLKKMGFEDVEKVSFSSDGKWLVKTKGGAPIVAPLYNYLLQSYGADPKVQELMRTQAYLKRKDYVAQNAGGGDPQQAELAYLNDMTTQLNEFARQQKLQAETNRDQLRASNTVVKEAIDKGQMIDPDDELKKALGLNDEQATVEDNAANYHKETLTITDPEVLDVNNISALRNKIDAAVSRDLLSKTLYDTSVAFAKAYESVDLEVNPYAKSAYDAALDRSKMMLQAQLDAAKAQLNFGMDIAKENLRAKHDLDLAIAKGEVKGNNGVNGANPDDRSGPMAPMGVDDGNLKDATAGGESDWRYSLQLLQEDALSEATDGKTGASNLYNNTLQLMASIAAGDNPSKSLIAKSVIADMYGLSGNERLKILNMPGSALANYLKLSNKSELETRAYEMGWNSVQEYEASKWGKGPNFAANSANGIPFKYRDNIRNILENDGLKTLSLMQGALARPEVAALLKANAKERGTTDDILQQIEDLKEDVTYQNQIYNDLAENNSKVHDVAFKMTIDTNTRKQAQRLTDENGAFMFSQVEQNSEVYKNLSPEKKQEFKNRWWDRYKEKQREEVFAPENANANITTPTGEIVKKYMRFDQAQNSYVVDYKPSGITQEQVLLEAQAKVNEAYRQLRKGETDLNLDSWSFSTNAGDLWDKAVEVGKDYYVKRMNEIEFDDKVREYATNYTDARDYEGQYGGYKPGDPRSDVRTIFNRDHSEIANKDAKAWANRNETNAKFFENYAANYRTVYNTADNLKTIVPGMDSNKTGGGVVGIPYLSQADAAFYAQPGNKHIKEIFKNYQDAVAVDPKGVRLVAGTLKDYENISDVLSKENSSEGVAAIKHFIDDMQDPDEKWTTKDLQRPRGDMTTHLVTLGSKDYVSFEFEISGMYTAQRTQSGEAGQNLTPEEQAAIASTSKKDDERYTIFIPANQVNSKFVAELRKGDRLGNYIRGGNVYQLNYNDPSQGTYGGNFTFAPIEGTSNILITGVYNAYDPSQKAIVPHTNIRKVVGPGENLTVIRDSTKQNLILLDRKVQEEWLNDHRPKR